MRDRLPEEHHVFASALPEIRAHFDEAAARSPDHSFVLKSVADELRLVEDHFHRAAGHAPDTAIAAGHVGRARDNLIMAAEGAYYYPMVAHEFDVALEIALTHQKRLKGPGL